MERAAFLARIRERLGDAPGPDGTVPPGWAVKVDDPVDRFRRELEAVSGTFHRTTAGEVAPVLTTILEGVSADRPLRVLVAPEDGLPGGTEDAIGDAGAEVQRWPEVGREEAAAAHVGITSAVWAVAETGSVVVASRPPGGRAPSLLPPVHVALVPVERLLDTTEELFENIDALTPRPSNVVVITGPSKSADIGMELARGVHGPGEVHVVLLG